MGLISMISRRARTLARPLLVQSMEQTVLEYKAELSRELTMHDRALVFTVQAFEVVK